MGKLPSAEVVEYARAMARAVDVKGSYFPGHSDSVAFIVRFMAIEAGIDRDASGRLEAAAMLHDVGKLLVPDAILRKHGPLTVEEFEIVKRHSRWGEQIIAAVDGCEDVARWVRHHHEHWNGSGYPDGLAGDAIPWQSRVILVADAFQVMVSRRPYKEPMSRSDAIGELHAQAGRQFDPDAVTLLVQQHGATASQ